MRWIYILFLSSITLITSSLFMVDKYNINLKFNYSNIKRPVNLESTVKVKDDERTYSVLKRLKIADDELKNKLNKIINILDDDTPYNLNNGELLKNGIDISKIDLNEIKIDICKEKRNGNLIKNNINNIKLDNNLILIENNQCILENNNEVIDYKKIHREFGIKSIINNSVENDIIKFTLTNNIIGTPNYILGITFKTNSKLNKYKSQIYEIDLINYSSNLNNSYIDNEIELDHELLSLGNYDFDKINMSYIIKFIIENKGLASHNDDEKIIEETFKNLIQFFHNYGILNSDSYYINNIKITDINKEILISDKLGNEYKIFYRK